MSKVTNNLQVTIPEAMATRLDIRPGTEVTWSEMGNALQLAPASADRQSLSREDRLSLFDAATERQRERERQRGSIHMTTERGWTRADLYDRGNAR